MKYVINGRIPSKKNSKYVVVARGRPFFIPSPNYQAWHKEQSFRIKKIAKPLEEASICITIFAPDKRAADLTNKAESIMDLLVDNKILKDDNWFVCGAIVLKFGGIDKENPRAEVLLLAPGDTPWNYS